ncbi:MAG TPA: ribosomal protein S18-alanine N-acetyltransferase [Candidatus Deferrimicrobium sp.]|nr:ribosomal protein S18-alanine N-acetyltransferase [Candidatus Deferrimicrobium sp.]
MNDVTDSSDTGVQIRQMAEADLREVLSLERQTFSDPWPQSAFEEQLSGGGWGALVALAQRQIIGYACYLIVDCEAHITNLAVHPDFRRKSVASRLLENILQLVQQRGCEYLLLEVRPGNEGARAFYERHGFTTLYRRRQYYRSPVEDALVLVRYLSPGQDAT